MFVNRSSQALLEVAIISYSLLMIFQERRVYFLKQKSEAFSTFKKFKVVVEKESGYEIKAMRSDRGGEL